MYDAYILAMVQRLKKYFRKKFFKRLGPAIEVALQPMDMATLWEEGPHNTFPYDPKSHEYVNSEASQQVAIPKHFRIKGPDEIKMAKQSIDLTFAEHKKLYSMMKISYQTDEQ